MSTGSSAPPKRGGTNTQNPAQAARPVETENMNTTSQSSQNQSPGGSDAKGFTITIPTSFSQLKEKVFGPPKVSDSDSNTADNPTTSSYYDSIEFNYHAFKQDFKSSLEKNSLDFDKAALSTCCCGIFTLRQGNFLLSLLILLFGMHEVFFLGSTVTGGQRFMQISGLSKHLHKSDRRQLLNFIQMDLESESGVNSDSNQIPLPPPPPGMRIPQQYYPQRPSGPGYREPPRSRPHHRGSIIPYILGYSTILCGILGVSGSWFRKTGVIQCYFYGLLVLFCCRLVHFYFVEDREVNQRVVEEQCRNSQNFRRCEEYLGEVLSHTLHISKLSALLFLIFSHAWSLAVGYSLMRIFESNGNGDERLSVKALGRWKGIDDADSNYAKEEVKLVNLDFD